MNIFKEWWESVMNRWEHEAQVKTPVVAAAPVAPVAPQATATAAPKVADAPVVSDLKTAATAVETELHKLEAEYKALMNKVGV